MDFRMQTLAKRCFYRARKSAALRRMAALPGVVRIVNAVSRRILEPPGDYPAWIADRLLIRRNHYSARGEKGLISFITPVWNTPVTFLQAASESLLRDQTVSELEWVVVDNGSTDPATREYLANHIAPDPRVKFLRLEENLGIIGGTRRALHHATGRYIVPLDHDDALYPDTVAILTDFIQRNHYPAILFSDEDKLESGQPSWPYFKPTWDPVLFLNSCYTAHLGCFDRKRAIELLAYEEKECEACPDWDLFLRFMLDGHEPVHIPEMLYKWRMHPASTAGDIHCKTSVYSSHQAMLNRYLAGRPHPERYELRISPLFTGTPDWWFYRRHVDATPLLSLIVSADSNERAVESHLASAPDYPRHEARVIDAQSAPSDVLPLLEDRRGLVCVVFDAVRILEPQWAWEALGLMELYPDTVAVGSRLINRENFIVDAGRVLGFAGLFGCPDRGRVAGDPGYSVQMWKQRSVSGASAHFCVFDVEFLRKVLREHSHLPVSWFFLGAWAAASARRMGKRVVYSPFLKGQSEFDIDARVSDREKAAFGNACADVLPDARFYSEHFGLLREQAYRPISELQRKATEQQLLARHLQPA